MSFSRWKSLIWRKEYLVTCAVYDQLGICYTLYLYFIFVFELFWNVYSNISMFDIFYSTKYFARMALMSFPCPTTKELKVSDTHCKKLWDQNGETWKQICYFGNPYKVVFFGFLMTKDIWPIKEVHLHTVLSVLNCFMWRWSAQTRPMAIQSPKVTQYSPNASFYASFIWWEKILYWGSGFSANKWSKNAHFKPSWNFIFWAHFQIWIKSF